MRVPRRALTLALAGLVVLGCEDTETAVPEWYADRDPMPSCGTFAPEDVRHDNQELEEAQECLREAFASGEPAELEVTHRTEEGDPVTDILRVVGEGEVEVLMDHRQDEFGSMDFGHMVCTELHEQEVALGPAACEPTDERRVPQTPEH